MTRPDLEAEGPGGGAPLRLRAFVEATAADEASLRRLRAGLRARGGERQGLRWPMVALTGLGALAALGLAIFVGSAEPVDEAAVVVALAPQVFDPAPGGEPQWVDPTPGLRLRVGGPVELSGTAQAPRLLLRSGDVRVEVDPAAGLAVSVHTQELQVDVLGTIFDVSRDATGASVRVERGQVRAACAAGAPVPLSLGEALTCAPTTAAGMLARARALQERGADTGADGSAVLEAVRRGLAMGDGTAGIRAELHVVAFEQLDRAGDATAALAEIDAYVGIGGPRAGELQARAAELALGLGGCEAALPYAQAAAASGTLAPDAAPRGCLAR